MFLEINGFIHQEDRIYTSKVVIIIQHYYGNRGNIMHSNYGNGTQPNKDFKVLNLSLLPHTNLFINQDMSFYKHS